jgi:hypothetical protein
MSLQASEVFSATYTGGRNRATHARSHPNTLARRHILAAKPRALRNSGAPMELRRQEPAPRRLAVLINWGCIKRARRVGRWGCRRCVPSAGGATSAEPSANALAAENTKVSNRARETRYSNGRGASHPEPSRMKGRYSLEPS